MKNISYKVNSKRLVFVLILVFAFTSCRKGLTFLNKERGVVINSSPEDCHLLIKSVEGETFEAFNYAPSSFAVDDRVKFTYMIADYGGFCMRGTIIEIKSIHKY